MRASHVGRMPNAIRSQATPWKNILLLCGKCARKLDGGYGPDGGDSLRSALRAGLREAGHRRDIRVIETRCLGVCPRKAVTMLNAARPESLLVVPAGTPSHEILAQAGVAPEASGAASQAGE